jgi:hypothetical protein
VGAVSNRDELGQAKIYNRGWKPLSPDINFDLKNDIGFDEVSYEHRLWPPASSLIGKET